MGDQFTLAFLDPPYGRELVPPALHTLKQGGWLANGAVIVVEQAKEEDPVSLAGYSEDDRRIYGAAQISFLRFHA